MRKTILILPDLSTTVDGESVLRQSLPGLAEMAERGEVAKLEILPEVETPEAIFLGLNPKEASLAQGPLTIAALGADPPERSTHFHLSLMAIEDGIVNEHEHSLPPEQVDLVLAKLVTLNTRTLTIVRGEGADHGLVWEGLGDVGAHSPGAASGKPYREVLLEGDNEVAFRRMIDDSVNILSELEFNAERIDQGLQPINLIWPWGPGVRRRLPNLALRRGEPGVVISNSLRLAGFTRLVGYRHLDRSLMRKGMNAQWAAIASRASKESALVVYSDSFSELRRENKLEEAAWLIHEIDDVFIQPLLESAKETPAELFLASPSQKAMGLGVTFSSGNLITSSIPLDERALEERLPRKGLGDWVDLILSP